MKLSKNGLVRETEEQREIDRLTALGYEAADGEAEKEEDGDDKRSKSKGAGKAAQPAE